MSEQNGRWMSLKGAFWASSGCALAAAVALAMVQKPNAEAEEPERALQAPKIIAQMARARLVGDVCGEAALSETLSYDRAMLWVDCVKTGDETTLMSGATREALAEIEKIKREAGLAFNKAGESAARMYSDPSGGWRGVASAAFEKERKGGPSGQAGRLLEAEALSYAGAWAIREGRYEQARLIQARASSLGLEAARWAGESKADFEQADKLLSPSVSEVSGERGLAREPAGSIMALFNAQRRQAFEEEWRGQRPAAFSAQMREESSRVKADRPRRPSGEQPWARYAQARLNGEATSEPEETPLDWRRETEAYLGAADEGASPQESGGETTKASGTEA